MILDLSKQILVIVNILVMEEQDANTNLVSFADNKNIFLTPSDGISRVFKNVQKVGPL